MELVANKEYLKWLKEIKSKVSIARIKVALAANKELIHFYFDLGKMISEQQERAAWGDKLLPQLSKDLTAEFTDIKGFSVTNLKYCKQFFQFYQPIIGQQSVDQLRKHYFGQHLVDQLPWGHNILIFTKSKNLQETLFYLQETLHNNWSREVLALQIKSGLCDRSGKAISNSKNTPLINDSGLD
jgi:predicted nuclease of restriction endonuclease-like (RecB) superfamily